MKLPGFSRVVGVVALSVPTLLISASASTPSTSNGDKLQNLVLRPGEEILGALPQGANEMVAEWVVPDRRRALVQDAFKRSSPSSNSKEFETPQALLEHRRLPSTGHVWDSCYKDDDVITGNVYNNTAYDDEHDPACKCVFDAFSESYMLHCRLNDVNCNNSTGACSETEELFTFAENTGDLERKLTCNFCTDVKGVNCTGIVEVCIFTEFDENDNPTDCGLRTINDDGAVETCNSCDICQDDSGNKGVLYDCFGQDTNDQCDTSGSAHVHNLVPALEPGKTPVGGKFGEICRNDEESALYAKTDYDDEYNKVCDCEDPSAGVIVCDLFRPNMMVIKAGFGIFNCFANQCTDISEVYYFSKDTGDMNEKTSCNMLNGLCSGVRFENGKPDSCSMLSLLSLDKSQCTSCNICQDGSGQYGITFDCYGVTQDTCFTADGNAVYNVAVPTIRPPTSAPSPVGVGTNPTAPPTARTFSPPESPTNEAPGSVSRGSGVVEEEDQNLLPTVLGATAGGVLLAVIFAICHKRGCSKSSSNSKAMVEADIEAEDAEPQPATDENDSPIAIT